MRSHLQQWLKQAGCDPAVVPDQSSWRKFLDILSSQDVHSDAERVQQGTGESSDGRDAEHLQAIYEAIPDALFLIDEYGRYLEVHAGSDSLLLNTASTLENQYLSDVMMPSLARKLIKKIQLALQKQEQVMVEYALQVPAGRRIFEGRIQPCRLMVNGAKTVVFLARDITERKKAEQQSGLVRTMFQAAREGVILLDTDFRLRAANTAFCELVDRAEVDLIGRTMLELNCCDADLLAMAMEQCREHGGWQGELQLQGRDGVDPTPAWVTFDPVFDDRGTHRSYMAMLYDISEMKHSQRQLEYIAKHDPLTGLQNRARFQELLDIAIDNARENKTRGAVMFLDLDRFKDINDNLGHPVGDRLLRMVATRLSEKLRPHQLSRFGGDEFIVLLEQAKDQQEVRELAKQLILSLDEPFLLDGYRLSIGATIGVVLFPRNDQDAAQVIKEADTAMYAAKRTAPGSALFFDKQLSAQAFAHFSMEQDLRGAVERGELVVHYQPQYRMRDNVITGLEALVRWEHPRHGRIMPDRFIPLAEITGQIHEIGRFVIAQSLAQLQQWQDRNRVVVPIAVNISRRQLGRPELALDIDAMLQEHGIPANALELEVTESAIMEREEEAYRTLHALRDMGCRLTMDDFGTGYSSMVHLKRFEFDRIKIDRTFIADLLSDPNDEAIVRATIALGRHLNMEVIAEGVESAEQRAYLLAEDCEQGQGFLYSPAIEPDLVAHLLPTKEQPPDTQRSA